MAGIISIIRFGLVNHPGSPWPSSEKIFTRLNGVVIDFNKETGYMKCLFASSTYHKTSPFNYFKDDMIKHNKEHYSKTELNRIMEKWWDDISDPEDKLYPLSRPYIIKHKDDRYCKSKLNRNAVCRLYTSGQICEVNGTDRYLAFYS